LLPVFLNPPNDPSENFMLQYTNTAIVSKKVIKNVFALCRHLKRAHELTYKEYQATLMKAGLGHGQATLTSFVVSNAGTRYESTNLRQRTLTMSVVNKLIIQCALPISLVDHPSFRSCLADFDPKYLPPCRQTVTNSILPQL